jgi:hypothetical protein
MWRQLSDSFTGDGLVEERLLSLFRRCGCTFALSPDRSSPSAPRVERVQLLGMRDSWQRLLGDNEDILDLQCLRLQQQRLLIC